MFHFFYKKLLIYEGKSTHCCRSVLLHCIKNVKIELSHDNRKEFVTEGSYFLEDGEIIEKIDDFWSSFEGSADSCESDDSHE